MYVFLLGRDSSLSKIELSVYFKRKDLMFKVIKEDDTYLLLDFPGQTINPENIIKDVAGVTRISQVYHSSKTLDEKLINKLDFANKKSFNYGISSINLPNEDDITNMTTIIKDYYREEKAKAVYKKPKLQPVYKGKKRLIRKDIINPDNVLSWGLLKDGFEIVVVYLEDTYYFAKTIACTDSNEFIFKDKHRPVQKELYSTSFRLTKMMLNILGQPKGKTILDPFCGAGNFLIEALIQGYDVIGIDKNNEMVAASRKNIAWAQEEFKTNGRVKLIIGDASKIEFRADAACFEPYMGPFLDKLPNEHRVRQILGELNSLYSALFDNLYMHLNGKGKIVCILPEFKTFDEKTILLPQRVFLDHGFKLVDPKDITDKFAIQNPVPYTTPSGSKISRNIYILEKSNISRSI